MLNLDMETLLALALFVYLVVSVLTLLAAMYGSRDRTLLYVAAGWFIAGGVGSLVNQYSQGQLWAVLAIWLSNAAALLMYGLIWAGLRHFAGKTISWAGVSAGAVLWLALCLWPVFTHSLALRVAVFSAVVVFYAIVSLRDLWPRLRLDRLAVAPVLFLLAANGAFYLLRALPRQSPVNSWLGPPDFAMTILENIAFVLGMSFSILVMVRAETERQYEYASLHDQLTGLFNRRALFLHGTKLLNHARSTGDNVAALMCDLDWFKQVNDEFGHDTGDKILAVSARALYDSMPSCALCARLGGEEFLLLFVHDPDATAYERATDIQRRLAEYTKPLAIAQTVSIGIAFAADADYDLDRLLIHADRALYAAKDAGRNCINVWSRDTPSMPKSSQRDDGSDTRFRGRFTS